MESSSQIKGTGKKKASTMMFLEHRGKCPHIHPSAATIGGNVVIGENACVLFGAAIPTERGAATGGGSRYIIMENAVLRK